jgi:beta-N-acetylhexosaminidase
MALKDSFRALRLRRRHRHRRRRPPVPVLGVIAIAAVVAALSVFLASGERQPPPLPQASPSGGSGPTEKRSFLERIIPGPAETTTGPAVPRSITDLARRLPLQRKVAQLFLLGFTGSGTRASVFGDLARLDYGGLVIRAQNYAGPQQLARLTDFATRLAKRHKHVPSWFLTFQDGGDFSELADLPPADAPSHLGDVAQAATEAGSAARSLRDLGINGVLGPDVDVDTEGGGAYTNLSFSNDPAQVGRYAAVTVQAYERAKMLTTPKHFPGLGAASQPTDDGPANVGLSLNELAARDLVPFKAAFDAGSEGVMLGHGLYTTDEFVTPASQSSAIATDLLRRNLRFKGIAVTDDLEAAAITTAQSVADAAVASIKAGADMVYISGPRKDQNAAYFAVLTAARRKEIPTARINEAVLRILLVKRRLGLIR